MNFSAAAINGSGRAAFRARLSGAGITDLNDTGIWMGAPGALAKVFREGDTAPIAGSPHFFGDPTDLPFALNDRGEMVFINNLTGPGVTGETNGSLWFASGAGELTLLAREGGSLSGGVGRTVGYLWLAGAVLGGSGDENGSPSAFNDAGQVTFTAVFTDQSAGIFTATVSAPSPAQQWRKQHFNTVENTGDAANSADPDGDGITNLMERATQTNPWLPNSLPVTVSFVDNHLEFIFVRSRAALGDVTFAVQINDDLTSAGWRDSGIPPSLLSDDEISQRVRTSQPAETAASFMRLSVITIEP